MLLLALTLAADTVEAVGTGIDGANDILQTVGSLGTIGGTFYVAWKLFVVFEKNVTDALRDQVRSEADARQRCDEELARERGYVAELNRALADAATQSRAKDAAHWLEQAKLRDKLSEAEGTISELRRQLKGEP